MTISARARDFVRRVKHSFKSDEQREFDEAAERAGYFDYQTFVAEEIARGNSGELKLSPVDLWLRGSENCSLKCIGCYSPGRFKKVNLSVEEARKHLSATGPFRYINLTWGEAFLNPNLTEVIELCKETHPEAKVWVISNGHFPMAGRYRRAVELIDRLALSVDGATKETFESIRVGGNFDKFLSTLAEVSKIRAETGGPKEYLLAFTATSTNLHELIDVVRLAHAHGVPEMWAQAMETKDEVIAPKIEHLSLDRLDSGLRLNHIEAAKAEAKRLGIQLNCSGGLYPSQTNEAPTVPTAVETDISVRMCRYPWREPSDIGTDGDKYVVRPCCYILGDDAKEKLTRYGLVYDHVPAAEEAYNSEGFWRFREDLAAGRTADICGNCSAAKGYAWKPGEQPRSW